ncbi:hypothetical protein ACH47C_40355 [Streptomyces rishiriensis]|uniref:hypothetical protein n=1 Tax=Streptomyces rishiriensis TaxID=68264 RepID=UPI0037B30E4E
MGDDLTAFDSPDGLAAFAGPGPASHDSGKRNGNLHRPRHCPSCPVLLRWCRSGRMSMVPGAGVGRLGMVRQAAPGGAVGRPSWHVVRRSRRPLSRYRSECSSKYRVMCTTWGLLRKCLPLNEPEARSSAECLISRRCDWYRPSYG